MAYEGFGLGGAKRPDRNKVSSPRSTVEDSYPLPSEPDGAYMNYMSRYGDTTAADEDMWWTGRLGQPNHVHGSGGQAMNTWIPTGTGANPPVPPPPPKKPMRPRGSRRITAATPPPMAPFVPKPNMAAINAAKREAKDYYATANQTLMADIEAAKAEVMRQYKLSRTQAERNALKRQLRDLENQKKAATKAIEKSYNAATVKIEESAKGNERMAGRVADRTFEFWDRAARAQAENTAATQTSSEAGAALGVGGMSVGGDVTGETAFSSRRGAADAAKQLDLGRIAAAEQRALASSLANQEAARQGELQRAALGMRNDAIAQSFAESNARIAQERAQQAAALQQLQMLGIQGQQANLGSMADIALDTGMQKSQLRNDWANAVAQAAAADAQAAYEAGGGAGMTEKDLAQKERKFLANHPTAPGLERMRQMNAPYRADVYGVMPSNSRVLAAEVEGLLRSQVGLSAGERRALAVEWLSSMEDRYGPVFLAYLNNVGGITQSQLGL